METYKIDPTTAIASTLPTASIAFPDSWGDGMLAVNEAVNHFYVGAVRTGALPAVLYTLDLTSGGLVSTQSLGGAAPIRLDYMTTMTNGSLFGARFIGGANNTLESFTVHPTTAVARPPSAVFNSRAPGPKAC